MPRIDVPFTVTEQVLRQYPPTLLRAGDKNYFYATFNVCEKWADVADLRAVFERSDLERPYVQDLVQGNGCYECIIPWEVMQTPGIVRVGVFGGDRILTNKVDVSVSVGCSCDGDTPKSPTRDWFLRIDELIQELGTPDPAAIAAAVAEYIAANPIEEKDPTVPAWAKADKKPEYSAEEVGAIAETELQNAINTALAQAKASGEFDGEQGPQGDKGDKGDTGAQGKQGDKGDTGAAGADGKSAYAYAVEGGYTGTEAEFAAKLAAEMPEALPNPYPLELIDPDTGETLASYDGSEAVAVEIPNGGGESAWETLIDTTLAEAAGLDTGEVPGKTEMLCVFAVPKCDAAISLTASSKAFGKALVGFSVGSASYGKIGFIFGRKVGGHATAIAASGDTTSTAPGLDTTPRATINLNYFRITDAPTDVPLKITSALPAGTIIKVFVR